MLQWPLQNMMDDMAAALDGDESLVERNGRRSAFDLSRHHTDTVMRTSDLRATAVEIRKTPLRPTYCLERSRP